MSISKNGMSAKEIERLLGVTYKTAWRMGKQIRLGMIEPVRTVSGTVEMDETYISGKESNKHKNKRTRGINGKVIRGLGGTKIPIIGMKSRKDGKDGKVIANVEKSNKKAILLKNVREHIGVNSMIMTDEAPGYKTIPNIEDGA